MHDRMTPPDLSTCHINPLSPNRRDEAVHLATVNIVIGPIRQEGRQEAESGQAGPRVATLLLVIQLHK